MTFEGFIDKEKMILNTLYSVRSWLSTRQAAKKSRLSWETAEKYLRTLNDEGFIEHKNIGKKDIWRFNFNRWSELREK